MVIGNLGPGDQRIGMETLRLSPLCTSKGAGSWDGGAIDPWT